MSSVNVIDLNTQDPSRVFRLTSDCNGQFGKIGEAVGAGDINGDGVEDLLTPVSSCGTTFIMFGKHGTFTANLKTSQLNGQNGFAFVANDQTYSAGQSVGGIDINADGIKDLFTGAIQWSPTYGSFEGQGEFYVLFGTRDGFPAKFNAVNLNGVNGIRIRGGDLHGNVGSSLASGDFNGDGKPDVLFGAPGDYQSRIGKSYCFFGANTTFPTDINLGNFNANLGVFFNGVNAADNAGASVAVGDINGDGHPDAIIGAPATTVSTGSAVYVAFGSNSTLPFQTDLATLNGDTGFVAHGVSTFDKAGAAVVSCDFNGDGIADVGVGAPEGGQNAGAVHLIFGSDQGFPSSLNLSQLNGKNGVTFIGVNAGDLTGSSLVCADFDGDGFADLAIAAPAKPYSSDNPGRVYVYRGRSTVPATVNLADMTSTDGIVLTGSTPGDQVGTSLSVGDINGDGKPDLVIGAYMANSAYVAFADAIENYLNPPPSSSASRMNNPFSGLRTTIEAAGTVLTWLARSAVDQVFPKNQAKSQVPPNKTKPEMPKSQTKTNSTKNQAGKKAETKKSPPSTPIPICDIITIGAYGVAVLYQWLNSEKEDAVETGENVKLSEPAVNAMKKKLETDIESIKIKFKKLPKTWDGYKEIDFLIKDLEDMKDKFKVGKTTRGDLEEVKYTRNYISTALDMNISYRKVEVLKSGPQFQKNQLQPTIKPCREKKIFTRAAKG